VTKRKNKARDLIQLVLSIIVIMLLNFIGSFVFHRFDLTSEKRYTLSPATVEMLEDLDDVVFVRVYLEGEFPAGFKRLRNETREMLDEFRAYAGDNIEYEFINPSADPVKKKREEVYRQLYMKGLNPTSLEVKDEDGTSQQIIFPGAIISYKGRELPLQLLKAQRPGVSPDQVLNNSVQALEYELANTIRKAGTAFKPKIAFIEGHGELDSLHTASITESLLEYYEVERVAINGKVNSLTERDTLGGSRNKYKAIIIAKPDSIFSKEDKFMIDQYVMNGGNVLWLIEPVYTNVDSLRMKGATMALPNDMKIEDQLFKYGVRVNSDVILDLECARIPMNKAIAGQPPQYDLEPWLFHPLVLSRSDHPIVKNLDRIRMEYASTIDTVGGKGIKKTVLLTSSKYSKVLLAPQPIDLRMTTIPPDERQFRNSYKPVAVLLEGEFESVYRNAPLPRELKESKLLSYKEKGRPARMIVVSDGDVIRNELQFGTGQPHKLGYDYYASKKYGTEVIYANETFILNCVNYLTDDVGLMSVRAREVKLRLLDKKKVSSERLKWQLINIALPVIVVMMFGGVMYVNRQRAYTKAPVKGHRASQARRFIAFAIDMVICHVLFLLTGLGKNMTPGAAAAYIAIILVYYVIMESLSGRTIGKFITRTVAVTEGGYAPSFGAVCLRTLCRFIPLEPLSIFFGKENLMWHDKLSGTEVIELSKKQGKK
jgi:ABC-2 type transport system permease protein